MFVFGLCLGCVWVVFGLCLGCVLGCVWVVFGFVLGLGLGVQLGRAHPARLACFPYDDHEEGREGEQRQGECVQEGVVVTAARQAPVVGEAQMREGQSCLGRAKALRGLSPGCDP